MKTNPNSKIHSHYMPYDQLVSIEEHGLNKREYFAESAMNAMISKLPLIGTLGMNLSETEAHKLRADVCETARKYADQMIEELNKC